VETKKKKETTMDQVAEKEKSGNTEEKSGDKEQNCKKEGMSG
jgi:hypothetical protein